VSPTHRDPTTHRLIESMHRLGSTLGPSPEDVAGIDVPRHQLRALFVVAKHGPMSVSALAEAIEATLASTSSLADRLVKAGYLEREPDPDDRRRVLLIATARGQEVADTLMRRFHERFERLVEAMSPEGREALEAGLTDMIRAAEGLGLRTDHRHHQHPEPGDRA
jgi:DNA-binding MarR family transcriptional regulator